MKDAESLSTWLEPGFTSYPRLPFSGHSDFLSVAQQFIYISGFVDTSPLAGKLFLVPQLDNFSYTPDLSLKSCGKYIPKYFFLKEISKTSV